MGKERKRELRNWEVLVDEFLGKLREAGLRCQGRSALFEVILPKIFEDDVLGERKIAEIYREFAGKTSSFSDVFGEEISEEEE